MSAPTLWEEGHWSGNRVTRLSAVICALAAAIDVVITGNLDWLFDVGFVLVCIGAALAVRPSDFFRVGVLPPLLLLGTTIVVSLVHRTAVADAHDGVAQGVVSGLTAHAGALLGGYAVALAVLAIRNHVLTRADHSHRHSNREASPVP